MGKEEVLQGGIYHFDNKPLIVKAWSPDMEFTREELYTVPIWVKLPGLDFKYWSPKGLSKIGSLIGKPLMVDQNTERKLGLSFARLLIEVEMKVKLPDKVFFKNERGELIEQKVQYDWKPTLCNFCKKYGHDEGICRKKNPPPNQRRGEEQQPNIVRDKGKQKETGEENQYRERQTGMINQRIIDGGGKSGTTTTIQGGRKVGWTTPVNKSLSPNRQRNQVHQGEVAHKNTFQVLHTEEAREQPSMTTTVNGGGNAIPSVNG
ncbi:uncharacterized protein [Solanum tuberosum]|uniref:uncharacterized protein n=1 Tax=Solanum tuberosum TaxID=4113 RepID=UPI00073A02C9|nr:PREDICTED: uncharacterized protein LOC107062425 [Solanum tuberosum]